MPDTSLDQQSLSNAQTDDELEIILPALTRRWLDNRRIVIFSLRDMARQTVDMGTKLVTETMQNWPKDQLYLAGYDFAASSVAISPYARHNLERLRFMCPDLKGFVAAMVSPGVIANVMFLFIREIHTDYRPMRVFSSDTEALAWLRSRLPQT